MKRLCPLLAGGKTLFPYFAFGLFIPQADMWSLGAVLTDLFHFQTVQFAPSDVRFWHKVTRFHLFRNTVLLFL